MSEDKKYIYMPVPRYSDCSVEYYMTKPKANMFDELIFNIDEQKN